MAQPPKLQHPMRLFLSAENLKPRDRTSASDSFFRIFIRKDGYWSQHEEGTVIMEDNNPKWTKDVSVVLDLEASNQIRCQVLDYAEDGKHREIGHVEFNLSEDLLDGAALTLPMTKHDKTAPSKKMKLIVRGERKVTSNMYVYCDFRCTDLTKTYFFSKDTTAISLHRLNSDGSDTQLAFSSWVESSQTPDWPLLAVPFADLCDCDVNKPFMMKMWRLRSRDGFMEPKGENRTLTVQQCLMGPDDKQKKIDLFDEDSGKDVCDIWIERFDFSDPQQEQQAQLAQRHKSKSSKY